MNRYRVLVSILVAVVSLLSACADESEAGSDAGTQADTSPGDVSRDVPSDVEDEQGGEDGRDVDASARDVGVDAEAADVGEEEDAQDVEVDTFTEGVVDGVWEVQRGDDATVVVTLTLRHDAGPNDVSGTYEMAAGDSGLLTFAGWDEANQILSVTWTDEQGTGFLLNNARFEDGSVDTLRGELQDGDLFGGYAVKMYRQ